MTVKTNAKWKCWWFLVGTYYLLSLLLFRNQCCCPLSLCLSFLILAFLIVTEKVTDEYWLNQHLQLHYFNSSVRKSIGNWHWSWGESRKAKKLLNATFSVIIVEHEQCWKNSKEIDWVEEKKSSNWQVYSNSIGPYYATLSWFYN